MGAPYSLDRRQRAFNQQAVDGTWIASTRRLKTKAMSRGGSHVGMKVVACGRERAGPRALVAGAQSPK